MKQFSCGDVVPGCTHSFAADSDDEIFAKVAAHAHDDHGLNEISVELAEAVRKNIRVYQDA